MSQVFLFCFVFLCRFSLLNGSDKKRDISKIKMIGERQKF